MSEAELHWLRQRLLGGKLTKAEQGELRFRLPVGLVYDLTGKVVLDPDKEVQAAVRLVFALFEQYGSALAVVKHFTAHHLRFPDRLWKRTRDRRTGLGTIAVWARPLLAAQPFLRRSLRLWTNQNAQACPSRRGAADQGADAPGEARGLADCAAGCSSWLPHLGAVSPPSTDAG